MTGFVVNNDPDATEAAAIANDPFYPDIDPANFRAATRQEKSVDAVRLKEALMAAITAVNRELAAYKALCIAASYTTLAAVPGMAIAGESARLHHYRRAVYSLAKAELVERYNDYDATNAALNRDVEIGTLEDTYRRDARWAIADLQDKRRSTVELI